MNDPSPVDARTSPAAVWKLVEHLKGDDLVAWRMADLPGRRSAEERNLTEPFPFGWYVVCYSDELAVGEVKPVRYFARELVVWRGDDGRARVLDVGAGSGFVGSASALVVLAVPESDALTIAGASADSDLTALIH